MNILKVALGMTSFILVLTSEAATLTGPVKELWVNDATIENIAFINLRKNYTANCGGGSSFPSQQLIIIDFSKPSMREAYSMALAATMSGKDITVGTSGICLPGTYVETLRYINITQP